METGSWDTNVINGYAAEDFLKFAKSFFKQCPRSFAFDILEGLVCLNLQEMELAFSMSSALAL